MKKKTTTTTTTNKVTSSGQTIRKVTGKGWGGGKYQKNSCNLGKKVLTYGKK